MNFLTMNFLTMDRSSNAKFRLGSLIKGLTFAIGFFPWVSVACAQVEFLGSTKLSGETTDKSGLSGMLETNTPINAFGGLSAIDYTGVANRYLVLSDRGAGDGGPRTPP